MNNFRLRVFNLYADYGDVPIIKFQGYEHYLLWCYVFTLFIGMFTFDSEFILKYKDL